MGRASHRTLARRGPAERRSPARTPAATGPRRNPAHPGRRARPATRRSSAPPRRRSPRRAPAPALRRHDRAAGTATRRPAAAAAASPASSSSTDRSSGRAIAGAVARLPVRSERPAMPERRQPGEGQRQHPIARPPARVRDEPDAARVVLVARVVQGRDDLLWRLVLAGALSVVHVLSSGEGRTGRRRRGSTAAGGGGAVTSAGSGPDITPGRRPRRGRRGRDPSPRPRA